MRPPLINHEARINHVNGEGIVPGGTLAMLCDGCDLHGWVSGRSLDHRGLDGQSAARPDRGPAGAPSLYRARGAAGPIPWRRTGLIGADGVLTEISNAVRVPTLPLEGDQLGGRSILLESWGMVSSLFVSVYAWARTHAS